MLSCNKQKTYKEKFEDRCVDKPNQTEMTVQQTEDHDTRVSIISPKFCRRNSVDLVITKSMWQLRPGSLVIKDSNGKIFFRIEASVFSFDRKRVMLDAAGVPIVTLREKAFSVRSTWEVFRGEGKEEKDLIFSARRSSIFQMKTKLVVFVAKNKSQDVCNYTVEGSWFERSCQVYVGNSSSLIAQMQKNCRVSSLITGKNSFTVTVNPNVDCAFVVALTVILDEIVSRAKRNLDNKQRHY